MKVKSHRGFLRAGCFFVLASLLLPLCVFRHAKASGLVQEVVDQINGYVRPISGKVVAVSWTLKYMTFPLTFKMLGVPYGRWQCFAMIRKGGDLFLYRLSLVDPFSVGMDYARMAKRGQSASEIMQATGLAKTKTGWLISRQAPGKYWKWSFFPWRAGDRIVPYWTIDHNSPELIIDAYIEVDRTQVSHVSSFLFGVAPVGQVQRGELSNLYASLVIFQ